ncbi:MAG TPA: hypothetical protein VHZ03_13815 [Trebonia sp.]|jgi:hypothetical protein|nr:hypothetical protein [Trebonia sp.]
MGAEHAEALEVLREVWRSQGQDSGVVDDGCETNSCRRMTDAGVGFDEFAGESATEKDLVTAWRDRLKREGKYNASGGTLRDLILSQRP